MKKKINLSKKQLYITVALLFFLAVIIFFKIVKHSIRSAEESKGIAYIEDLENRDLEQIKKEVGNMKDAQFLRRKEEKLRQYQDGEIDIWSFFGDYMILGDSRAEGFKVYEFISDSQVLADRGDKITNILDHEKEIITFNPSVIIFSYGLNDIGQYVSADDYVKEYSEVLSKLKSKLPNTQFYINSIIPKLSEKSSGDSITFTNKVEEMCKEQGYGYIDCTALSDENKNLYEQDGVHFKSDFYPIWAEYIIKTIFSDN